MLAFAKAFVAQPLTTTGDKNVTVSSTGPAVNLNSERDAVNCNPMLAAPWN